MICNMDCFHCVYDDCINDDLSLEEYQAELIDSNIPKAVQMARIRANRYAENHREENRQRALKSYYDNQQKYNDYASRWQKENKDRVATSARERYHKNIEQKRQYQRDYRAKKKGEMVS